MITIQLLLSVPEEDMSLLLKEWSVRVPSGISKIELIELILVNAPAKRDTEKYSQVSKLVKKYN